MIIIPSEAKEISTPAVARAVEKSDGAAAETILLIHGTSANRYSNDHADWWHPGSDFCSKLDALLKGAGAEARCWEHLCQVRTPTAASLATRASAPFAWSGANSERDRHGAGRALANELARLESDPAVRRYHLIGHSHGGNVMLHALRALPYSPKKLGEAVFLGAPVLSFLHREALDIRWIAIPIYIAALGACLWAFQRGADDRIYSGTAALAIVIALVADLLLPKRHSRRPAEQLYGSGRASAFVFGCDEAIQALESAQQVARHPKRFIDQFIAKKEPPPFAFDPTPVPQQTLESQIEGTGAYAMLRALQPPPAPALPGLAAIAPAPAITRLESAGDRLRSVGTVIDAATAGFPFKPVLIATLWICAALPLSLMLIVSALYVFVVRVGSAVAGRVVLFGGRLLGAWALPVLVRKAAMGADFGRFLELQHLPPAVARCEDLSEQLIKEAATVNCRYGQDAGLAMTQALVANDAFAIKSSVENALTNSALAHSHYYKAAEVQTRIAHLIATPAPKIGLALPSWLTALKPMPFGTWIDNAGSGTPTSAAIDKSKAAPGA